MYLNRFDLQVESKWGPAPKELTPSKLNVRTLKARLRTFASHVRTFWSTEVDAISDGWSCVSHVDNVWETRLGDRTNQPLTGNWRSD